MSRPTKVIVPASGRCAPAIAFSSVLLPEPLGPISPWKLPGRTVTSTPSRALSAPKRLPSPRTSKIASAMAAASVGADALARGNQDTKQPRGLEGHDQKQHQPENDRPDRLNC